MWWTPESLDELKEDVRVNGFSQQLTPYHLDATCTMATTG